MKIIKDFFSDNLTIEVFRKRKLQFFRYLFQIRIRYQIKVYKDFALNLDLQKKNYSKSNLSLCY